MQRISILTRNREEVESEMRQGRLSRARESDVPVLEWIVNMRDDGGVEVEVKGVSVAGGGRGLRAAEHLLHLLRHAAV